MTESETLNS